MKKVFRYRIITNLNCNQNPQCYFCFQPDKRNLVLDIQKMKETLDKVGELERATIMGGESTLLPNLAEYIRLVKEKVKVVCLVTNGILLNEKNVTEYKEAGLEEMAISISSMEMYQKLRNQILIANRIIPNCRINIPKCWETTGEKLYALVKQILEDNVGVVVCEDLMGRYGEFEFEKKMGAKLVRDDGHNFLTYEYQGKEFGVFAHYSGYDKTDIIITPIGNFSSWEKYCETVGNTSLK